VATKGLRAAVTLIGSSIALEQLIRLAPRPVRVDNRAWPRSHQRRGHAALVGAAPNPAACDTHGGGFPFILEPSVLARLKGGPRPGRELQRRHPEDREGLADL
jgi:hypothetical protein